MVSGINEELMGSALDDKAGILSALRQGAGLTTLQPIFDRLDYSQNLLGEMVMKIVQNNYTPGKVKNLLEGEEPAPLFYNKAFGKYHCMVELGFNTESQKQMEFAQLMQLREMGVPIPDASLIESATIQEKDKMLQIMQEQQQQQQQTQQMQMQAQIQEQQARTELAHSRSIADKGLGVERFSRVEENKALAEERRAAAVKDDQMALLNFAKAIKEIQNIDIDQLHKIISLHKMMDVEEVRREQKNPQPNQNGSGLVR